MNIFIFFDSDSDYWRSVIYRIDSIINWYGIMMKIIGMGEINLGIYLILILFFTNWRL